MALRVETTDNYSFQFLSDGGEMAELTLKKNWEEASIGPISNWPHSLRTTLGIIFHSAFPMFLFWGDGLICFYNDAFRPSLGIDGKHPAIGKQGKEVWPEIWEFIGPLIKQVMTTGRPVYFEDQLVPFYRNGKIEDIYWTFSYSPAYGDNGMINGVFVTCVETTEKVNNLKLLEESNDQLAFAIEAAELGTFDYNPITNRFVANDRLKMWFGLPKQGDIILDVALGAIAESDKPKVLDAIQKALSFSSGGVFDIDYAIINPETQKETIVHAKGRTWFNDDKIAYRLNGTLQDITQSYKAEKEKQNLIAIIEASDEFIGLAGLDTSIQYINPAGLNMLGWKNCDGRFIINCVYPDDREFAKKALSELVKEGKFSYEIRFWNEKTGEPFWILWNGFSITDANSSEIIALATVSPNINDRKKSENELFHTAKHLQTALEAGNLGSYELNIQSGEIISTPQSRLNYGLNPGDPIDYERLLKMVLDEDKPTMRSAFEHAIKNNVTYNAEYRVLTPGGEIRWIHASGHPIYNEQRVAVQMAGVTINITEQKTAELKLRNAYNEIGENQKRLNLIIEASELGTWEVNLKTREIKHSDRFAEIVGYDKERKLSLEESRDTIHPDEISVREEAYRIAFKTGVFNYRGRIIWKDKSIHWIESKGKVFFDENNQPATIIGTVRDITEDKMQQEVLLKSEQRFRLLADSMPQFVWTGDAEGNLNYFNESVYNYSGLSREQVEKEGWIQIVHPDERQKNIDQWIESIQTGKDFIFEHRFRRFDGEYRWQLSRAIPQKDAAGDIQMWVGTSTDVQDQKVFARELERLVRERTQELNQKNIELEKMNAELQSFAYVSSHDLQEPLRKIQTYTSILNEKEILHLSDSGKYNLTRIEAAAKRMQLLIEDLLRYSRTSTVDREFEMTDLGKIIEEVKSDLRETIAEKNAIIETGDMCKINIVRFQFKQLMNNLIGNSLKFSRQGKQPVIKLSSEMIRGEEIKIEAVLPDRNYCHISISDNGIGFDPRFKERIFQVFQRLHGKDKYAGTGIGLAIVKKIVENHNGVITATGMLDEGARFDIYIPVE